MRKQLRIIFWIAGLGLLSYSCVKVGDFDSDENGDFGITYDLAFPLVDQYLTFADLLPEFDRQFVISGPDGLLRIVYREEFTFGFDDLGVFVPDIQPVTVSFPTTTIPPDVDFVGNSMTFEQSHTQQMVIGDGIRIESARSQEMDFRFQISTQIQNPFRIDMIAHNVVDANGRPLQISRSFPGSRTGNQGAIIDSALFGYSLVPDNSQPTSLHMLNFNYTITVYRDTLITHEQIVFANVSVGFRNIELDHIFGYFGMQDFEVSGYTDLSIFDQFPMDLLEIEHAEMQIRVTNAFGIPIAMNADISTLRRNPPNERMEIVDARLDFPSDILAPPVVSPPFQMEIQHLINDDIGNLPYRVQYSAILTLNPDNNPMQQNFASRNSFVRVEAGVEIPMRLRIGGLVVSDTIDFAGLPFPDGIISFSLRANLHNAFPIDAAVSLFFLDGNFQIIDSVWALTPEDTEKRPLAVPGGRIENGRVVEPAIAQMQVPLSNSQIENLRYTRHIKIVGVLSTSNQGAGMVNIFENSQNEGFLRVMIGARVRATLSDVI